MDAGDGADGHRYFEDLAVAHVLGGLDETEGRALRSHLLECADCRARVGELRAIAHELADVERAERRERAAQTLETKRRDDDDELGDDDFEPPSRLSRVVVVGSLLLLVALVSWNLALRTQVTRLEDGLEALEFASEVLELGEPADVTNTANDVEGTVKVRDNHAVVLVDGLQDGSWYGLYIFDHEEKEMFRSPVRASNGRVFPGPIPLQPGAATVRLTTVENSQGNQPSGWTVFEAQLPTTRQATK